MSTPTATAEPGRAPGDADPRRWIALAVVLIAGFMQLVDISIVNVAIPSIQRDLDATYAQIQWVLAGYQLAFAVMLITGGRLGDIFGRKRMFMAGMAGFTLASALCGLAQTPSMLIGSRVLSAGSMLLVVGMVALMWTVDRYGGAVGSWQLAPALLVCGLGLGSVVAPLVNVVLAGIRGQDAGAASGVLSTVQQVGGAVGVAVIGVVFFGLLGSQAAGVADDVIGGLQRDLQGAGLPPAATRQVAAGFRTCFEDRANARDPSAVPASCARAEAQGQGQEQVGRVVAATADTARRANFSEAFQRTLWFEVAVFLACFLLVFLLPDARGDGAGQHAETAAPV